MMNARMPSNAQSPSGEPGPLQAMGSPSREWDVGEVLTHAWDVFRPQWVLLVGSVVLTVVISAAVSSLSSVGGGGPDSPYRAAAQGVGTLAALVVSRFFAVGMYRMTIAVARGQEADLGLLFSGLDGLLRLIAMSFLMMIGIGLGLICFVVPGIYLACAWALSPYYVVDQGFGPIEALRASYRATDGYRFRLFMFELANLVVLLWGYMACCVGALVSIPVAGLAHATVYLRLSGTDVPPATYDVGLGDGYGPPPDGGFGAPGGGGGAGSGAPPRGGSGWSSW